MRSTVRYFLVPTSTTGDSDDCTNCFSVSFRATRAINLQQLYYQLLPFSVLRRIVQILSFDTSSFLKKRKERTCGLRNPHRFGM